jgi:RNase P subunit RPR2
LELKKVKKKLAIILNCAILNPVSERNNNEIMTYPMTSVMATETEENNTVLVSCCGCGEELRISQEEADQWTDTDWFQCHECE